MSELPPANEVRRLLSRFEEERRRSGIRRALHEAGQTTYGYAAFPFIRGNRHPETFQAFGRDYVYFRHPYNRAWMNERTVELALAFDFLRRAEGRTLELGNVTAHYGAPAHDVLDKYEDYPGVINEDVVSFEAEPYDNILSISTIEHVGFDEAPREPAKVMAAYRNLYSLLRPGGRMLITCPLGYNPHLDELIFSGEFAFPHTSFLKRMSKANTWREVDAAQAHGSRYGSPFQNANSIFAGLVEPAAAPSATE